MGEYLGGNVDESAIKESFSLVYQLLEEMMDNGYPLTTEPNALKAMIRPPTTFVRMVSAATGKVCLILCLHLCIAPRACADGRAEGVSFGLVTRGKRRCSSRWMCRWKM